MKSLIFLLLLAQYAPEHHQPVGASAAWCKPEHIDEYNRNPMDKERYKAYDRTGGSKENPIPCKEILDTQDKWCMVRFDCNPDS